ncbi:nucleotide exchange factor GrpE [Alkalicoccus daliensis]|uniref:Protein GrpE n=1 Tax=Alkalicoccus daliensis TaxID=745820 RepID=A0A1H0BE21_9BACI|nr:nucleotide exchange factor GrpE [Alkalicoccus daliensis]SDN43888.1 molecular chaperone GrpE [Alkalicoccus daliensis]
MSQEKRDDLHEEEVQEASETENNASSEAEDIEEAEEENAEEVSPEAEEIEQLKAELEEAQNRNIRLQADYDNFRRRTKKEKEEAAKFKSQKLAESLLPAIDNFERALTIEPETEEAKNLLQGMKMVYNQISEALQSEQVKAMDTVGQPFDPHMHQAVMQVEEEGYESNVIVEELQKGYTLNDKVIRPAMVKVNA